MHYSGAHNNREGWEFSGNFSGSGWGIVSPVKSAEFDHLKHFKLGLSPGEQTVVNNPALAPAGNVSLERSSTSHPST